MKEVIKERQGLYRQEFEHDNCGIGAVVNIKGKKSHDTVANALRIVENLDHRAGKDAEGKTGDGVGILLQISHKFFKKACKKEGIEIGQEREYGIGQFFFPQHEIKRAQAKKMFEIIVEKEGLEFLGWREVPVVPEVLGHKARECMPCIMQAFIKKPDDLEKGIAFDRKLYIARREFEQSNDNTYVVSMSSRTIVYKGMFLVGQLRTFFGDLQSQDYESAIAVVHSRFSTNTNPSWERAHPNRFIVHNGEINTIRGNADKMLAREENMDSPYLKDELHKVLPVVNRNGSDSAMLDNTLEFLVMSGMDLPLAVMITIPEPWANNDTISQEKRDFYQYYATMMEPWDGPASILFSDGDVMGCKTCIGGGIMYRYILFDLDGTLTDPKEGITKCVQYALKYFGIEADIEKLVDFIGPPLLESFQKYYHLDDEQGHMALKKYRERFSDIGIFENGVYPGIAELLSTLKAQGRKIALATSKPGVYAKRILERYELLPYFDVVVGSELDGRRTDKGEVITEALRQLEIQEKQKPEVLMIGDRLHDKIGRAHV